MRLGLGTASLGLDYGISNRSGKTPPSEAGRILGKAWEAGIRVIDTAAHYGDSEEVLGRWLPRDHGFRIITKVPAFRKERFDAQDGGRLREIFLSSLRRLRQERVEGLLLHNPDELFLLGGEVLFNAATSLVSDGLVAKVGVSVYTKRQIELVLAHYPISLIQVPVNIFDHRLIESGALTELHHRGVEIHVRSAFLQGLVFMDPTVLPPYFESLQPLLSNFHVELKRKGLTPGKAALAFLRRIEEIHCILIGVNTAEQLEANIRDYQDAASVELDFGRFKVEDEKMINPNQWRLTA
jgi:aryl-alcohol dehydrogenase-like predicted oxidoreductase